jgi:hypothetical protein
MPDFNEDREMDWSALGVPLGSDVITVSEFARFVRASPYEIRCLMADGVLIAEPGVEPPRLHRGCNLRRYVTHLRAKALARCL